MDNFVKEETRSSAIKKMLSKSNAKDLYELYSIDMEVQVNVAQDDGYILSKEYHGPIGLRYTNDRETWFSFRIPHNAATDPEYIDSRMSYNLDAHAEAIGMTGWNWADKRSIFVAFDFDSIIGHAAGLTLNELEEIKERASDIPWVTVRQSTSGSGIHLYVFLDFHEPVLNHTEHAALARAILNKMSSEAGYNFSAKVDVCGGIMWSWARKMIGTDGLRIIKQGEKLSDIPANWQKHVPVIQKKTTRTILTDDNDAILAERRHVPLDDTHKKIIKAMEGTMSWWDADRNLLVTHTATLKKIHEELGLKGIFDTVSTTDAGVDHNCFCVPLPDGAFVVYRFQNVQEHPTWFQDSRGASYAYFNRNPDLKTLSRKYSGIEREKGGFIFESAETATLVLEPLGIYPQVHNTLLQRQTIIQDHKDGRVLVKIQREDRDQPMAGWELTKDRMWTKIFAPLYKAPSDSIPRSVTVNDSIRHIVDQAGHDAGWVLQAGAGWHEEPLVHIKSALKSQGFNAKEIDHLIGTSVTNCWVEVNKPFRPEYPGNREWNRNAPQFAVDPSVNEDRNYEHWMKILKHCGQSLDLAIMQNEWCKKHGIHHGSDYLKCWVASLFQYPEKPLPYLFFYGPQNSGKSIFHESLSLLFHPGYVRADNAITNPSGFTGELANAVLCVVEEIDLRSNKPAYNRIKDWVTSLQLVVHTKFQTPYQIPNVTHWLQCANDRQACPIFPGDTRIVVCEVPALSSVIPKEVLIQALRREAADFLAEVLSLALPPSPDRLNLPIITSEQKAIAMENNVNLLERFIQEKVFYVPGEFVTVKEFFETYHEWLDPVDRTYWSKIQVGRQMPSKFPRGRIHSSSIMAYGNLSFRDIPSTSEPYMLTAAGVLTQRDTD